MVSTNLDLFRPRDRDDVRALREEPRERDLARRCVVFLPDVGQPVRDLEDVGEVRRIVAGHVCERPILETAKRRRSPRDFAPEVLRVEVIRGSLCE